MTAPAILQLKDLQVRQGRGQPLNIAALDLLQGEVLAVIGPNGAGKSTLLLALAGLLEIQSGQLLYRGTALADPKALAGYRRKIAMVFQEPLLLHTTVQENIATGLKVRKVPAAQRRQRAAQAARRLGVEHLLARLPETLSGGEAQRVSLARALVLEPEILFLDEPFSSLDSPTRESLLRDLEQALSQTPVSVVLATHDQGEALRLGHRIAVLDQGRLRQLAQAAEVMNHPADEFVAAFVGMELGLEGVVQADEDGLLRVAVGGRQIEVVGHASPGQSILLGIRPEDITLACQADRTTSARNHLPARVTRVLPKGPLVRVELDCGFFLAAYLTRVSAEELALKEGQELIASFKATAVHLIRKG